MKRIEKIFGDPHKRAVAKMQDDIQRINALEPAIQRLSDAALREKTDIFRDRLASGTSLDELLHEAFAVVREAARRTLGQRHYDVQLLGGMVLHRGNIAEMRTGEGKTLAATTATYLKALSGNGVHIVTVNDYLARRDADWMGQIYYFLGLRVGCIQHDRAYCYDADLAEIAHHEGDAYEALIVADMSHLREVARKEAYDADITFGTNNEFGFDYLRDNMVINPEDRVQRGLHFAIIDEVDSILIDEARTPLIISAPSEEATEQYYRFAQLVDGLQEHTDYTVDEKMRSATLTEAGITALEKALGVENLYVAEGLRTVHHIEQALKAKTLFHRDKDYVVHDGEVVIIDEFTGRMLQGRRYSEGLHQAIEAKEHVPIKQESRTLATITLQNYFRLYQKRAGMTGTAETEAEEFYKIYGLNVVVIPTHRPMIRKDFDDRVYKNKNAKFRAVIERVKELHAQGQPILLGTVSIENNELLSELLTANGIPHNILNAKQHEREAEIIAQAGKWGAVTVATNMAGRGVDIILGGNPPDIEEGRRVRDALGLAVIGTERHEARRIDNQLRGRAGRQGDPGASQFFVSLDDDVMRIFGSERLKAFMTRLGVPEDMPIENRMVSRSIEAAQKKVESRNFDIRKHLVEYDDVMNKHRDVIYKKRNQVLNFSLTELRAYIQEDIEHEIDHVVSFHLSGEELSEEEHNPASAIIEVLSTIFPLADADRVAVQQMIDARAATDKIGDAALRTDVITYFVQRVQEHLAALFSSLPDEATLLRLLRGFILRGMDMLWVEHLDQMNFLRDTIGLRGYGQRDPLVEYKQESYKMFQELLVGIQRHIVYNIFKLNFSPVLAATLQRKSVEVHQEYHAPAKEMEESEKNSATYRTPTGKKVGRNESCPCGSGKKYKKCHGI